MILLRHSLFLLSLLAMLPLFYDDSKSVAMIRHSMHVIKQAVQKLNPSSTMSLQGCACDHFRSAMMYAIGKMIQWNWTTLAKAMEKIIGPKAWRRSFCSCSWRAAY